MRQIPNREDCGALTSWLSYDDRHWQSAEEFQEMKPERAIKECTLTPAHFKLSPSDSTVLRGACRVLQTLLYEAQNLFSKLNLDNLLAQASPRACRKPSPSSAKPKWRMSSLLSHPPRQRSPMVPEKHHPLKRLSSSCKPHPMRTMNS